MFLRNVGSCKEPHGVTFQKMPFFNNSLTSSAYVKNYGSITPLPHTPLCNVQVTGNRKNSDFNHTTT
jgi:hypothetical protein